MMMKMGIIEMIVRFIPWYIFLILIHELGHALVLSIDGNFKEFRMVWKYGAVETVPYTSEFDLRHPTLTFFSGILFNLATFPIAYSIFPVLEWDMYVFTVVFGGIYDIISLIMVKLNIESIDFKKRKIKKRLLLTSKLSP